MKKHFRAIVEDGYQILQTPGGERVNYLTKTVIAQTHEKVGECVFSVNVNYKTSLHLKPLNYDPETKTLRTPSGEVLEVEILSHRPKTSTEVENATFKCSVVFPYETGHKNFVPDDLKMIV